MQLRHWSVLLLCFCHASPAVAQTPPAASPAARIDGTGLGWVALGKADFVNVNCDENTWTFPDSEIHCTGNPVGVMRTVKEYRNLELVVEWRHLKPAGNSGVFLWASEKNLASLKRGGLPEGIEVQILDHGYTDAYRKSTGKEPDWFTTNGDVFPTGNARMTPFPPVAPNSSRSFPRKKTTRERRNGTTTTSAQSMVKSGCGSTEKRSAAAAGAAPPPASSASNLKAHPSNSAICGFANCHRSAKTADCCSRNTPRKLQCQQAAVSGDSG